MEKFTESSLERLAEHGRGAVVFADDAVAEYLHWNNGVRMLLDAGVLAIRDIKHSKECLDSETKAVFVVSSVVNGNVCKFIQRIVQNSDFETCVLVSTLTDELNQFVGASFKDFSTKLKQWMAKEFASVSVEIIPLFNMNVTDQLFITTGHSRLFPVLPSDVARLQAFLHSRNDKRVFNHLGEIDFPILPLNVQANIKMLSHSLNAMFESMDVHEDCYAVGHFSKFLATDLANMPAARGRRKVASSRASVIFIDRTLDLVAPMSHRSESALSTVYEILPRLRNHNNDVAIDCSELFAAGNVTPTTLFHGSMVSDEHKYKEVFNTFSSLNKRECIIYVCKKLKEIVKEENLCSGQMEENYSLKTLEALVKLFRCKVEVFCKYCWILQPALALLNTYNHEENEHIDELLSAEKVMMLEFGSENSNPFSQILALLTKKDSRFSVVDALMFCLMVYSADGSYVQNNSYSEEEKLKEALINILMDGDHKEDLLFFLGDLDSSERQIRTCVADIFEKLKGIGQSRATLNNLRYLLVNDGVGLTYQPLVNQVLDQVFHPDRPELVDIEFCSHGFKDFLKTGFGFFMNVSKPRPDEHPMVVVFVVGGITWYEVKSIKQKLKQINPKQKVIIGSTRLVSCTDIFEQVLCTENLFVDVE